MNPFAKKLLTALFLGATASFAHAAELRLGIIGLDTSHVTAFTELLNNPAAKDHVPGAKVVAACKGGSADIPLSIGRVEKFTAELRDKYGVKICDTIEQVCAEVDAVLLESVDGRPHLDQARIVIAANKPLFIDKPLAGTLRDALEIFRLANAAGVPFFTSSSTRFARNTQAVRAGSLGQVRSAETTGPAKLEPHHPDLYWYGVHGCESLFTVMGAGCESVQRRTTPDGQIEVAGQWNGGRTGIFRESETYGGTARGEKGDATVGSDDGYAPLLAEIVKFFQTRQPPVPAAETIELFAFMEAADESKRRGGERVALAEVLAKAAVAPEAQRPAKSALKWKNGLPADEQYFPIAVWVQDPKNAARYKAAGINLYVGLWRGPTTNQLAELQRAGMSVICG
ncbi:MAG: Gfo/Idh/MocA family oxidoreductase, partial [Verrucomicrobiales bacterium]|nr:Gfo/Idh/MocA family oxidoreductase [Verrucomicrobiales bacterium]